MYSPIRIDLNPQCAFNLSSRKPTEIGCKGPAVAAKRLALSKRSLVRGVVLCGEGAADTPHGNSLSVTGSNRRLGVSLERRALLAGLSSLPVGHALFSHGGIALAEAKAMELAGGPRITLNDGLSWPLASFGLQVYDDDTAKELTLVALEVGYRNFFASVLARNQKGFARAVKESGIPRAELTICGSVLSNSARGFDAAYQLTKKGCSDNLKAFSVGDIGYVDMIMLDYPGPDAASIRGQWAAMEEMKAEGGALSLAVSNFSPAQLDVILADASATRPTVNQLPYNVNYHRKDVSSFEILEANKERRVHVQAWAPLGGSTGGIGGKVKDACKQIGAKYGKSSQQVALRWIIQTGASFSTQTRTRKHFQDDLDVFDFELSRDELDTLSRLA